VLIIALAYSKYVHAIEIRLFTLSPTCMSLPAARPTGLRAPDIRVITCAAQGCQRTRTEHLTKDGKVSRSSGFDPPKSVPAWMEGLQPPVLVRRSRGPGAARVLCSRCYNIIRRDNRRNDGGGVGGGGGGGEGVGVRGCFRWGSGSGSGVQGEKESPQW
jgi:hypothetical protein